MCRCVVVFFYYLNTQCHFSQNIILKVHLKSRSSDLVETATGLGHFHPLLYQPFISNNGFFLIMRNRLKKSELGGRKYCFPASTYHLI